MDSLVAADGGTVGQRYQVNPRSQFAGDEQPIFLSLNSVDNPLALVPCEHDRACRTQSTLEFEDLDVRLVEAASGQVSLRRGHIEGAEREVFAREEHQWLQGSWLGVDAVRVSLREWATSVSWSSARRPSARSRKRANLEENRWSEEMIHGSRGRPRLLPPIAIALGCAGFLGAVVTGLGARREDA